MDLTRLLADVLTSQGYDVEEAPTLDGRSGAAYPASLIANVDGERLLVDVLASRPVSRRDIQALDAIVQDTGVDGVILFAIGGLDDGATTAALETEVDLRGQETTRKAVGTRILEHVLEHGEIDLADFGPTEAELGTADVPPPETEDSDAELLTDQEPSPATARTEPGQQEPQTQEPETQATEPEAPAERPEPAVAEAGGQAEADQEFLSPEEMAQRAKEMMEKGELPEDGDAELIIDEDDEPSEPQAEPRAEQQPAPEPSADRQPVQAPDQADEASEEPERPEGEVFEEGDCELLPSDPQPEEQAEAEQQPAPTGSSPEAEPAGGEPTTRSPSASASSPAAAAGAPPQGEDPFLSGGVLEPRIDNQAARREAEAALFQASEARLELLPFHVFAYRCTLEGDGRDRDDEGQVWVSAQSGAAVQGPDGELVDDLEIPNERFQGTLERSSAAERARDHLLENLETREELQEDYSETAIIERVTLTPKADTLELEHLGKAFAPRWRVEGQNGTVFVDALTGDLVAE